MIRQRETLRILRKYGISYPKTKIFDDPKKVKLTYPVALKIDSSQVVHKSDGGFVKVGIDNHKELVAAAEAMKKKVKGEFSFVAQEMVEGVEFIMGMKRDETFGPVIIFGLGGVLVELIGDINMRVAPLKKKDRDALLQIRAKKIMDGYRGIKVNKKKLSDLLKKLSDLSMKEDFTEIDFNPVIANEKEAYVVDARFLGGKDA